MPKPGTVFGDVLEQFYEQGEKIGKEVIKAPVDIVKASFEQPIPLPTQERTQQLKAEEKAKLAKVRSGIAMEQEFKSTQPEEKRVEQGATITEKGKPNQQAQINNQLSANMTPKKKPEPLVVQQKRNNKLHGAG
ncbi:MAG: hypothetical protein KBC00_02015 [Candidatus Levybacteria bacterium]|nr:hypothetical protein [Candidatus Levybacteria bacterium]MBP9815380.1 hypothetical protein [Candidatus Levybacteria bacterium]